MAVSAHDLKRIRIEAGKTLRDLEEPLGLSNSYLSKLERGQRNPDLDVAAKWGEECGFDLVFLGATQATAVDVVQKLNVIDADIMARLGRILPGLDPAHRATLLQLLDLWERSAYSDEEAVPEEERPAKGC